MRGRNRNGLLHTERHYRFRRDDGWAPASDQHADRADHHAADGSHPRAKARAGCRRADDGAQGGSPHHGAGIASIRGLALAIDQRCFNGKLLAVEQR